MTKLNKALSYFPIIALGALCYLAITDRTLASEKCADQVSTETAVTDRTKILIIGEMHGTQQGPAYFCAMVHALLQKHAHVLVALELPDQNQPLIDSILMSNGDAASTTALLATPFWRRDDQDGRSSEAMLGLLGSLANLKQQYPGLSIVAIDHLTDGSPNPDRDKNMAFSFETKRRENPDDTVAAVLIGNFHNRRPTPSDVEWKPNFLSYLDEDNIVSLTLGASGGTAWICASGHHCGVIPWSPSRVSSEIKPGNIIMAPPGTGHYDGLLFIGGISPSPPAVKQ